MARNLDNADSKVIFKEKKEKKGVRTEKEAEDATIW